MLELIIWLGALLCPNPTHTLANHGDCTHIHMNTASANPGDTGGETGNTPKPPVPPPPPPTGG